MIKGTSSPGAPPFFILIDLTSWSWTCVCDFLMRHQREGFIVEMIKKDHHPADHQIYSSHHHYGRIVFFLWSNVVYRKRDGRQQFSVLKSKSILVLHKLCIQLGFTCSPFWNNLHHPKTLYFMLKLICLESERKLRPVSKCVKFVSPNQ